jgi:hypothetical protein
MAFDKPQDAVAAAGTQRTSSEISDRQFVNRQSAIADA